MKTEDWAQAVETYNRTYKKNFKSIEELLKIELERYTGHRATLIRRLNVTKHYLDKIIKEYKLSHLCIGSKKGPRIFWEDVVFEYNEKHNTNFKSDKILLQTLYNGIKNIKEVAIAIFVSWKIVHKRMVYHGIKRSPRGGTTEQRRCRGPGFTRLQAIPDSVTSELTPSQLANRVGCAYSTMSNYLRHGKKPFRSGLNPKRNSFDCVPGEEHSVSF